MDWFSFALVGSEEEMTELILITLIFVLVYLMHRFQTDELERVLNENEKLKRENFTLRSALYEVRK